MSSGPRADEAPALLAVSGLRYAYGERVAVDGISFQLRPGEVFGLLGPNGAGKTTAISCLCGLLAPAAGTLALRGEPFAPHARPADRARLGYVPQEIALYEGLTARENLRFFARLQGTRDTAAAVAAGLALAGLEARADDRVATFSGGMKRRLNLAAGLVHQPEIALLDEPTAGVDPQSRAHIVSAIGTLKATGCALLYTSHAMDEVQRLCDRLAIMDSGRLIACGTAAELAALAGTPGADLEATFLKLTGRNLRDETP
ncbi:MAG TPA: ABC transporter ATP-binding protein [Planctomycetota bacterium]|nr:ABC transporter ATP-binding protein [Planctomycetota bacterium]